MTLRRELKFVFEGGDVDVLRRLLLASCRRIRQAGSDVSIVHSVYFDDARLSNCRANLDGVGIRHKTRLRWYDSERPTETVMFERKWRRHRWCGKDRVPVACGRTLADGTYSRLWRELDPVLPPDLAAGVADEREAIAMIEYRREHFAVRGGGDDVRLTLDYDIRCWPQAGSARYRRRFAERLDGVVLIECKVGADATEHRPDVLPDLLRTLPARAERFSKYATACIRLGYVRSA